TPALAREVRTVVRRLRTLPQVQNVHRAQTSADGRSALVELDIRGDAETATDRVKPVLAAVSSLQRKAPSFTVAEFGSASLNLQAGDQVDSDLSKAELLSLPITFAILLIAFGAFVAAGIPVLLAMSAVFGAIGLDA